MKKTLTQYELEQVARVRAALLAMVEAIGQCRAVVIENRIAFYPVLSGDFAVIEQRARGILADFERVREACAPQLAS